MASKNDVVAYLKDKIIEAGYRITVSYDKEKLCLVVWSDKYETPKICGKSELFVYAKAFYYIFIQKLLKIRNKNS